MMSLKNKGLLDDGNSKHKLCESRPQLTEFSRLSAGNYFVVGLDIEQYDPKNPEKYLMGILHKEQEPWVGQAFQSYLAVFPSPLVGFEDFSQKVTKFHANCFLPECGCHQHLLLGF
jgi:hypothetical protein